MGILDFISSVSGKIKPIIELFIVIWSMRTLIKKISPVVLPSPRKIHT